MIYQDRSVSRIEQRARKTQGKAYRAKDIAGGILKTLIYEYPRRKITVELATDEFTCICPFSGLPDFAKLTIRYTPRKRIVEMKSLKYYLYAYRQVKIYNEHVVNKILGDLKKVLAPHCLEVVGEFTSRGGIHNKVIAHFPRAKR